jgi:hypothetical protein
MPCVVLEVAIIIIICMLFWVHAYLYEIAPSSATQSMISGLQRMTKRVMQAQQFLWHASC